MDRGLSLIRQKLPLRLLNARNPEDYNEGAIEYDCEIFGISGASSKNDKLMTLLIGVSSDFRVRADQFRAFDHQGGFNGQPEKMPQNEIRNWPDSGLQVD